MQHELIEAIEDTIAEAKKLPDSRAKSLVLTKLDEARLWAQEALLAAQIATAR